MLPLQKGIFLVAAPALRDPNFRQTVVLLCEHSSDGALGVVVNRPTAMSISEALPQVPILEGQRHVLFAGGPVQTNQVMLLYRLTQVPENSHPVFDGVCLGGDLDVMERIARITHGMGRVRKLRAAPFDRISDGHKRSSQSVCFEACENRSWPGGRSRRRSRDNPQPSLWENYTPIGPISYGKMDRWNLRPAGHRSSSGPSDWRRQSSGRRNWARTCCCADNHRNFPTR